MKYALILSILITFTLFAHATNATLDDVNTSLRALDNRLATTNAKLDGLAYTTESIRLLALDTKLQITDLSNQFENVSQQLVGQRVLSENANSKLDNISAKIEESNQRLQKIEDRVVNLTNAYSNGVFLLQEEIQASKKESVNGFLNVEGKVDGVKAEVANSTVVVDKRFGDVLLPLYALAVLGVVFLGLFVGDKVVVYMNGKKVRARRVPSVDDIEDGLNGR
jgi:hypothetical protein